MNQPGAYPFLFVSVDYKGLTKCLSLLESAVTERFVSVDSKRVNRQGDSGPTNQKAAAGLPHSTKFPRQGTILCRTTVRLVLWDAAGHPWVGLLDESRTVACGRRCRGRGGRGGAGGW